MSESDESQARERIGARIRAARESAGLSARELGRRVDVAASHVSQVERGLASFSVVTLYRVVSVLGISMDSLFDEPAVPDGSHVSPMHGQSILPSEWALDYAGIVLRAKSRPSIPLSNGRRWERLTPLSERGAEFIEVIYPPNPGQENEQDFGLHSSREYGVITQGSLTVEVGFDRTVLQVGDSIAFDSHTPHRYWNATSDEVRAIWFILEEPRAVEHIQKTDPPPPEFLKTLGRIRGQI